MDPKYGSTIPKVISSYSVVFICVPTPMKEDGYCDTSILDDVMYSIKRDNKTLVVIKSTVPPKQIGSIISECLVTGFYREDGAVVLATADQPLQNGAQLG